MLAFLTVHKNNTVYLFKFLGFSPEQTAYKDVDLGQELNSIFSSGFHKKLLEIVKLFKYIYYINI